MGCEPSNLTGYVALDANRAFPSFEKDGTFMNAERRIQRVRKAIEPLGEAKPDWEIICLLARAMGRGELFNFASPEEVWDEVRAVWQAGQGISYARIEQAGLQWPCPNEAHPGTTILHTETFPLGKRAALRRVAFRATPETVTEEFPFLSLSTSKLGPIGSFTHISTAFCVLAHRRQSQSLRSLSPRCLHVLQ